MCIRDRVYAVEAGSAGEAVATEKGWEFTSVAAQADALMEAVSYTHLDVYKRQVV